MSTLTTDTGQDALFDLAEATPVSDPSVVVEAATGQVDPIVGRVIPTGSFAPAATIYLDHLKAGKIPFPGRPYPHRVTDQGAVSPAATVWDAPNVSRVADPTVIAFTADQVDALLLSWVILHKTMNPDLTQFGFVHLAALTECAAYLPPLVEGHRTIHAWHQHAEALHAICKHADARIVSEFLPKVPPPKMTPAQAARSAAQSVGGWGPWLRSLQKTRKTVAGARFIMRTGRPLSVGATPDATTA